ncbi:Fcf2 domain-containing protein [Aspergillus ibericus CBS 121593]|uniref:Nucleolus protein required for cell viability n=1 Tax=Aspergillus ibericus CBS 121593 TaxID=1448316 RepID=A0A395GLN4_9EURO|nr:nucleolus protein required for cell viability [Aspergillus ibericus CBS 121593]RAK96421.1 nucleolus protein required for cell viability [Aspergillus ibericus CBS 121593]
MTGATCVELAGIPPQGEVGLNDQDIEQLLYEAEDRLRPSSVEVNAAGTNGSAEDSTDAISVHVPKLASRDSLRPYVRQVDDIAVINPARITGDSDNMLPTTTQSAGFNASKSSSKDKPTAGSAWFDLPKTELTAELKRDLQLLRMRSVLDPKRHYKKESGKAHVPQYSHVGTIIEGPTEFFSSRIVKRDRKKTFVEEALAVERENKRFEAKYRDIQTLKQSGKRSYYNNLRAKRKNRSK